MVRSLIGFTCIQHAFGDSVLMQTQSQSDHILDVLHTGSSRVLKMQQNTEAMEDQYRSLLQNIVSSGSMTDPNTGEPWKPPAKFLETVETQFNALKEELEGERKANDEILANASAAVAKCNSDRSTAFSKAGGIVAVKDLMTGARGTHSTCRKAENTKIDDMETACKAFDDVGTKCTEDQDWYAQYEDASVVVSGTANTLAEAVDAAVACAGNVSDTTEKANECDGLQTNFTSRYCTFADNLKTVCNLHSQCYELQSKNLNSSTESVLDLEKEQKIIWKMVQKVECYLDALMAADENSMPDDDTIKNCTTLVVNADILNITVPAPVLEDACLQHADLASEHALPTYQPGKPTLGGKWYTDEYGLAADSEMRKHGKLNADAGCTR